MVKLDRGGAGVVVGGSGVCVRLDLREGVDEAVEVLVHAPARLDPEDRDLLVLPAAKRLVVHLRFLSVGELERRARAQVRAILGRRVAVVEPDDGPVGDVSVHPLSVERALGHVEERDVGVLLVLRAAAVRVVAQPAVSVGVADTVEGRADRVCDADGLRAVRDGFEDVVVRVVRGSARGSRPDGERVGLVVLGGGEGDAAVAARLARAVRGLGRGRDQNRLVKTERESHRRAKVVAGESVGLEPVVVEGDPGHRAWRCGGEERRGRGVVPDVQVLFVEGVEDARVRDLGEGFLHAAVLPLRLQRGDLKLGGRRV